LFRSSGPRRADPERLRPIRRVGPCADAGPRTSRSRAPEAANGRSIDPAGKETGREGPRENWLVLLRADLRRRDGRKLSGKHDPLGTYEHARVVRRAVLPPQRSRRAGGFGSENAASASARRLP